MCPPHHFRAFAKRSAFQNSLGWVAEILRPSIALVEAAESVGTIAIFVLDGFAALVAVTAGVAFNARVMVALKDRLPGAGTEVLDGLMRSSTATVMPMAATLAEADFVGSATMVATTMTVAGDGTLDGGV